MNMISWRFILVFIGWTQIWRLVLYAGETNQPLLLILAVIGAFALTVWPFGVFYKRK